MDEPIFVHAPYSRIPYLWHILVPGAQVEWSTLCGKVLRYAPDEETGVCSEVVCRTCAKRWEARQKAEEPV